MIWLIKKIFGLAVLAALVFVALQFQVGGRPLKEYVINFYRSPLVGEAVRQARDAVGSYLRKDVQPQDDASSPMDKVDDDEREELEKVIRKQSH